MPFLGKFDVCFAKSEKNLIPSLKFGKFEFKNTLLERPFFRKKITLAFFLFFFYKGILYKINPDQISRGNSNERKRNKKRRKENRSFLQNQKKIRFQVSNLKKLTSKIPSWRSLFFEKNYYGFLFIFFYKGLLFKMNPDQISKKIEERIEKKRKDWLVLHVLCLGRLFSFSSTSAAGFQALCADFIKAKIVPYFHEFFLDLFSGV